MFTRPIVFLFVFTCSAIAFGQSEVGKVYLFNGQIITGRFNELTKDKVVVSQQPGGPKQYSLNEVKFVQLPGEPKELMDVRQSALRGEHDHVMEAIEKIPPASLKTEQLRQEVDFYRALAMARAAAAAGGGDATAAGRALLNYLNANKESHHFYDANEAVGDLLVSMQQFDKAPRYYGELANAPWPDAKMRAAIAIGRSLQAQDKHEEAIGQFDEAAKTDAKGKSAETLALAAGIGKAKSTVALGRTEEGIKILKDLIGEAPAENVAAHALAYNALGEAYQKTSQPKEALYAYLHTDVLYNQAAEQHAEALFHLKDLWQQVNQSERAKEAADLLKTRYASSRWNK